MFAPLTGLAVDLYLGAAPEAKQQVLQNANQIVEQLKKGGSFVAYARQYSQASTAAVGGDLGWVRLEQLPTELATAARDLAPGQLVGPIELRAGYSIIYLIDKRQVLTADPRDAVLALKQISISFPAGMTPADAQRKAGEFATAMKQARGCGGVEAVAGPLGAVVRTGGVVGADAVLKHAAACVAVSEAEIPDYCAAGVEPRRIRVIPNPLPFGTTFSPEEILRTMKDLLPPLPDRAITQVSAVEP